MTGFEGISGNADLIVFFKQDCDEWGCDNSTCWDDSLDCVDNGVVSEGVYFMETVSSANAGSQLIFLLLNIIIGFNIANQCILWKI